MTKTLIFAILIIFVVITVWFVIQKTREVDQSTETPTPTATPTATSEVNEPVQREDGLIIEDMVVGDGKTAESGDTLDAHYLGTLEDGTKFDSSYDRGQTIQFVLGSGQLIQGWELGLVGMKEGGKRKLVIPPELAYGDRGAGGLIPPNATLTFEIELVGVTKK